MQQQQRRQQQRRQQQRQQDETRQSLLEPSAVNHPVLKLRNLHFSNSREEVKKRRSGIRTYEKLGLALLLISDNSQIPAVL